MKADYETLRKTLENSPENTWGNQIEEEILQWDDRPQEIQGRVQGLSVDEVKIEENSITAQVYCMVSGDTVMTDGGQYQDDDGDSYDIEEEEYSFYLEISEGSTRWTKE
jgi:hypothetical protein